MFLPRHPTGPAWASRPLHLAAIGLAGFWAIACATAAPAAAEEMVQAIATPGRAKLQICRSWVMYNSCNEYGRVDVPDRIGLGDQLPLAFGSNPKSMNFPVATIRFVDGVCTLYAEPPDPDTDETKINKLTIEPCRKPGP
jgi:hypothetical protein